jgi:WD40 repeat protein
VLLTKAACTAGAVAGALFLLGQSASAAEPLLQLNPGGHWAPIRRIAASPSLGLVATASDDKTARVWSLETGRLLQVLRPPIGKDSIGKLYGVAFHPSRPLIAVGGSAGNNGNARVFFFDAQSGEALSSANSGPGDIKRIAWSGDGKWLVIGKGAPGAVVVLSADGRVVFSKATAGDCYGVAISTDNTVAATDTTGKVHVLRIDNTDSVSLRTFTTVGSEPVAAAFSRDGTQIAVAYFAQPRSGEATVDIFSANDGSRMRQLAMSGVGRGRIHSIVWSGDRIAVGGSVQQGKDAFGFLREFDVASGRGSQMRAVASDSVTDVVAIDQVSYVFGSFDSTWGIVANGLAKVTSEAQSSYAREASALRISAEANAVEWSVGETVPPYSFRIAERVIQRKRLPGALPASLPGAFSSTSSWENSLTPKINGVVFPLAAGEISRAVARIGRSDDMVWGTGHRIVRVSSAGNVLWSINPGTETRAVNSSVDGRLIVAAMSDATLRWYRARDGQQLLSLLALKDGQWILWTPSGYYDASPGAEMIIGWHLNREGSQTSDFFSIGRFRDRLFRPDVIDRILVEADEQRAIEFANREREAVGPVVQAFPVAAIPAPVALDLPARLPPSLAYKQGREVRTRGERVTLAFAISLEKGQELTSLVIRLDGVKQTPDAIELPAEFDGRSSGRITVNVPEGVSIVHVVAENRNGFSDALAFVVTRETVVPPQAPDQHQAAAQPGAHKLVSTRAPRLVVLAIGVSKYADQSISQLIQPAKDARDFAAVLGDQKGRAYSDVVTRVLTDDEATRDAIMAGLGWLSDSVGERDYGMLFLAGHGVNFTDGRYYFLSHDTSASKIPTTAVEEASIRFALVRLKGRGIFFVDTCYASNAVGTMDRMTRDVSKIANELASPENGIIVFASSTGRQESQESDAWGNGAFTRALVAGLRGAADLLRRGSVTFQGLGYFVSNEVEKVTGGRQTPVLIVPPPGLQDFTLALSGGSGR